MRKARYNLVDAEVRPYFALHNVLHNGVFYATTTLYGITFQPRQDIPVYHPDVKVYEIFDEDGTLLALFYTDLFARDNKSGGAWMGNFIDQSTLGRGPGRSFTMLPILPDPPRDSLRC